MSLDEPQSFDFDDSKNESSIAKGGYGFVYKATYKNKNSCHKKNCKPVIQG